MPRKPKSNQINVAGVHVDEVTAELQPPTTFSKTSFLERQKRTAKKSHMRGTGVVRACIQTAVVSGQTGNQTMNLKFDSSSNIETQCFQYALEAKKRPLEPILKSMRCFCFLFA